MSLMPWYPFADGNPFGKGSDRLMNFSPFPQGGGLFSPRIEVCQTAEQVIVKAEIPGMDKKAIDLSIDEHCLQLSGRVRKDIRCQDAHTFRSEHFFGSFSRTVPLPVTVKSEQARAEYRDGILTVTIPRAEPPPPGGSRIDIR